VYIQTSLATNSTVFERYRRHVQASGNAALIDLFDDVIVEHQQALETTKIYSAILDSAIDHFGLILDYDLNHTMQLVATLTLVLCVPTVIGGMFGMNLAGIPLAENPYGFSIVTGITVIVLAVLLIILKRLKWF
ncbi:MAG: CorA family divalent cation transporter, partial [Eggerthellaceae bacterium]